METGPRSASRTVVWLATVTLTGAVLMGLEMGGLSDFTPLTSAIQSTFGEA